MVLIRFSVLSLLLAVVVVVLLALVLAHRVVQAVEVLTVPQAVLLPLLVKVLLAGLVVEVRPRTLLVVAVALERLV
jgi:hypothetical protein